MGSEIKKRIITSILLIGLLIAMYFYSYIMIISLIIIAMITWIEFYGIISKIFTKKSYKHIFYRFIFKSISLFYLFFLVFFLFSIESYYLNFKIYVLYSILVAIMSDIGGLVFGKTFKGLKLTKISPNKTISGSIGSFIFSLSLIPLFIEKLVVHNYLTLILITITISLATQVGDLLISYLKRKAQVKNTSNILPGHGGFLDRIDGIILAIPIGALLFYYF